MNDRLVAFILGQGKWLTVSMSMAFLAVTFLLLGHRHSAIPIRRRILAAMSLFFGVTIGTMAFGHLLAVTTKLAMGTVGGSVPALYVIGAALAVPSWWLICHTRRVLAPNDDHGGATLRLNSWLVITLLAMGIHNLPLAAPGLLNVAYHLHSGRMLGRAIVVLAVVANVGLFIASVVFLTSGQSFEQFRGI